MSARIGRIFRGTQKALLLSLVAALGCGGPETDDVAASSSAATVATAPDFSPTFFSARRDLRKCAFPMCGGYFVASVNGTWPRCPNGSYARECYVSDIDLSLLELPADQEAQVREAIGVDPSTIGVLFQGKLSVPPVTTSILPAYPKLIAAHAWLAPAPTAIKGSYFGLVDTGIVCIKAPCPSISGLLLNQTQRKSFDKVDLSAAPGTEKEKAAALESLSNGDGLVAVGPLVPIGPVLTDSSAAVVFPATQFFQLVKKQPQDPCATVRCASGYHCEPKQVECFAAPCPPIGVCVADPVPPVRCGGIAGTKCPGVGQCVDDLNDTCDPSAGSADCGGGGVCVCKQTVACPVNSKWNGSPSVCACEPTVIVINKCGDNLCGAGEYCCNESCGICAPIGGACIQLYCGDSTAQ
jgi:hypothetical protein